jgi:hypothetical protein
MPYINAAVRANLAPTLNALKRLTNYVGEGGMNYVITCLIVGWIGSRPPYSRFNAAIGVLDCVKLELYRRMVAPYEDIKCEDNGDVYSAQGPTNARRNP